MLQLFFKTMFIAALLCGCTNQMNIATEDNSTPRIDNLDKVTVEPGDTVVFSGVNLSNDLTVMLGTEVLAFVIESPTKGYLTLPSTLTPGVFPVNFLIRNIPLTSMPLLYGSSTELPVIIADSSLICSDTIFANAKGETLRGARICSGWSTCRTDGELNCLTNTNFPAIDKAATLTSDVLAKISSTVSIAGVTGTLSSCTANGSGCLLPSYDGVANLQKAVPPCTADAQIDCAATSSFPAMNISPSFISPWDIRLGKTAGGVAGKLAFNQNRINNTVNTVSPSALDLTTTVDDLGAMIGDVSTQSPSGVTPANTDHLIQPPELDTGAGGGVQNDGICNGTEVCVIKDLLSGLYVSPMQAGGAAVNWTTAVSGCDNLNYGGSSEWRLPTQKDAFQLYTNNIFSKRDVLQIPNTVGIPAAFEYFWLSTTWAAAPHYGFYISWHGGWVFTQDKTGTARYLCVR